MLLPRYVISSHYEYFNTSLLVKVHPTVDAAWSTITLLRKVEFLFDNADTHT